MENNIKKSKIKGGVRRFAIGSVAALAALGVAGAGTAAAAPNDNDAPVVDSEAVEAQEYAITGGGPVLVNGFPSGDVSGGHIGADGTGVIEVAGGEDIVITSSYLQLPWGGVLVGEYEGLNVMGELEMVLPGVYAAEFEDFLGFMEIEIPFMEMAPVA